MRLDCATKCSWERWCHHIRYELKEIFTELEHIEHDCEGSMCQPHFSWRATHVLEENDSSPTAPPPHMRNRETCPIILKRWLRWERWEGNIYEDVSVDASFEYRGTLLVFNLGKAMNIRQIWVPLNQVSSQDFRVFERRNLFRRNRVDDGFSIENGYVKINIQRDPNILHGPLVLQNVEIQL